MKYDAKDMATIRREYNLLKVIDALTHGDAAGGKKDLGIEREISADICEATGKFCRGIFVPAFLLRELADGDNGGSVSANGVSSGSAMIETQLLAGHIIDALLPRTVLGQAGVTNITGLVGDISLPKDSGVGCGWLSEGTPAAPDKNPTFSSVLGTAHTAFAKCDITRLMLRQSSIGAQKKVANDICKALMRAFQLACLEGTGADGQPTGLAGVSGVNEITVTAGNPTRAEIDEFIFKVSDANADLGCCSFVGSPRVRSLLSRSVDTREVVGKVYNGESLEDAKVGEVAAGRLCEAGFVDGFKFIQTNLCAPKKLYFGDWSQMNLCTWGGLDIFANPYSLSTNGGVRVQCFFDCEMLVGNPTAFAIGQVVA